MTDTELDKLVDRFLRWPLPKSVCSDLCVTESYYAHGRVGTNLLTAAEARQMLEYVLAEPKKEVCSACSGSGYYDHNGSPPCGGCDGKGYNYA